MNRLRLRTRLLLAYFLLIVLGFGGLAQLAGGQIARGAEEDLAQGLQDQTALLARSLDKTVEHVLEGKEDQAQLFQRLNGFATQTESRLLLRDVTGRIWFDSAPHLAPPEAGSEVAAALVGSAAYAVRGDAAGVETVYAAAPIEEDDEILSVVQLARPVTAAAAAVRRRWWALAGGVGVLGLLAAMASVWLAASLARPLEQLRASALRLAAGDLDARLPDMGRDEIGQVATAFNDMASEVQAMLEEQRAFASNASHELRTPLTTIRLRSEALRAGTLDPAAARQYIAEIDDEAARLGGLVEDLILLSRLDAGRAERGQEAVDMLRLARAVLREFGPHAERQEVALRLDAPVNLPTMRAATNHMRVVLRNLLGNAISYTPPGGTVTCTLDTDGERLLLEVTDTGQGVAPEDLPHLFERFYRADKAHTRVVHGAGLGLSLVQSIVQAYGGEISIDSPGLGQGTTVRVVWPLGSENGAGHAVEPPLPTVDPSAPIRPANI